MGRWTEEEGEDGRRGGAVGHADESWGGWRMSMLSILRRNWALRVSVVLNICVLLYVCAHYGSSGPWIEEPPTNWAAPLQSETFGGVEAVNGTQRGAATSSAVPTAKEGAGKGARNTTGQIRARHLVTRPTANDEARPDGAESRRRNQTVSPFSLLLFKDLAERPLSNRRFRYNSIKFFKFVF